MSRSNRMILTSGVDPLSFPPHDEAVSIKIVPTVNNKDFITVLIFDSANVTHFHRESIIAVVQNCLFSVPLV